MDAVGSACNRPGPTEAEIGRAGIAKRPAAGLFGQFEQAHLSDRRCRAERCAALSLSSQVLIGKGDQQSFAAMAGIELLGEPLHLPGACVPMDGIALERRDVCSGPGHRRIVSYATIRRYGNSSERGGLRGRASTHVHSWRRVFHFQSSGPKILAAARSDRCFICNALRQRMTRF